MKPLHGFMQDSKWYEDLGHILLGIFPIGLLLWAREWTDWRMLEALKPEFLTWGNLALALGYKYPALQIRRDRVLASTELRVRRLYEQHIGRWEG